MKLFRASLYRKEDENKEPHYRFHYVALAILAETKEEAMEKAKQFSPDYIPEELPTESKTGVEDFWRD